jgi:hypothetical protein
MTTNTQPRWIDTADVAKLIRKHLKSLWPETTFSVRISRYSGGSSVRVRWTDGPTQREVETVAGRYCGSDFDGMTDSTNYREPTLVASAAGLELVKYAPGFVFCDRELSVEKLRKVVAEVSQYFGISPVPQVVENRWGHSEIMGGDQPAVGNARGEYHWTIAAVARRWAEGDRN